MRGEKELRELVGTYENQYICIFSKNSVVTGNPALLPITESIPHLGHKAV